MLKKFTTTVCCALAALAFMVACNQPGTEPKTNETPTADSEKKEAEATTPATTEPQTVKAQFVNFTLGDAEHYVFKDEKGEELDFGGCDDKNVKFGVELPEKEANETNQGWGANKSLQNKWFNISYIVRKQPLYTEGPEGDVKVIVKAEEVK
ncbi:hypothetical protein C7N43_21885 [Sphingobacteriales bacterium UPWRP_1]|nr:hypothetical protein BVG80_16300 [Sphingobacteriales bacterium TSM_CSM]PSJ74881.1 hypothetical protein C7N43_21885 [Sphingobacteriales bacterium UPWRP_1]